MVGLIDKIRQSLGAKPPKTEDKRHPKFQQHLDIVVTWGPLAFKAVGVASAALLVYSATHCVYGNLMRGIKFAQVAVPFLYLAGNGHVLSTNFQAIVNNLDDYCPKKGMEPAHKQSFNTKLQEGTIGFGPIANQIANLVVLIYKLEKASS